MRLTTITLLLAAYAIAAVSAGLPRGPPVTPSPDAPTDEEVLRSRAPWAIPLGVAIVAIVVTQLVARVRWMIKEGASVEAVASALQREPRREREAEASAQLFPVGARVLAKARGAARVLAFDAQARTYDVAVESEGGDDADAASVTLAESDLEVAEVSEFVVYPIKSCAGLRLDAAEVTATGIRHDRLWMFADENGKFISQRRFPTMALIAPKLLPDMASPTAILLTAPGMEDLEVPILRETQGKQVSATVWGAKMRAVDQGDEAAAWVNKYLADARGDRKLRFLRVDESFKRVTDPKYAPNYETGFADGFPFLVALQSSLAELNQSLDSSVPMNRFRPNIVLKGAPAFADEDWNCFVVGDLLFRNVKPCARCNLPCVDQATGVSDPNREPSKTLTRLRNGEVLGFTGGKKYDCYFGSNLVAERFGTIKVGDRVKVLTLKKEVVA